MEKILVLDSSQTCVSETINLKLGNFFLNLILFATSPSRINGNHAINCSTWFTDNCIPVLANKAKKERSLLDTLKDLMCNYKHRILANLTLRILKTLELDEIISIKERFAIIAIGQKKNFKSININRLKISVKIVLRALYTPQNWRFAFEFPR